MALSELELEKQLTEAGNQLLPPPPSAVELVALLDRVENFLTQVEQSPSDTMRIALAPSMKALVSNELLRHSDVDVKVAVASCISEITRITAPDAPYDDDQMKEVFQLIVSSFAKLDDKSSQSYAKRTSILETVAKVRSCVVMLDLECDALIAEMFQHFFRSIRSEHPENVFTSMETIMTLVLEESEEISVDLLSSILGVLKTDNKEVLPVARQLGEKVIEKCVGKLRPYLVPTMKTLGTTLDDYTEVVSNVLQAGSEANDTQRADVATKNAVDEENNLAKEPSEKAVEVAMETLDDAPPSEDVGPTTVGSPKAVASNGMIQKEVEEDASARNDNSKEKQHEAHVEEAEPSKPKSENSGAEEPPKTRTKPEKVNKRKGKKPNSSKSSSEPSEPPVVDEKEVVEMPEVQEKDEKDLDNEQSEAPVADTTEPAENEKESEAQVSSPKTSDKPANVPSSPSRSLADEMRLKKSGSGKKKDEAEEGVPAVDIDLKKESDAKKSPEGASVLESKSHKRIGKKAQVQAPSATEKEDILPSSADASKKEDEKTSELDAKSAKQSGKKVEVGTQPEKKQKRGQGKVTPAKDLTKTPSKDEGKKSVSSVKSAAKSVKDESDVEKASKTNSKRKRSSEKKVSKYGKELLGSKVQVWWPDDKKYYEGVIEHFDPSSGKHKVMYNDGDVEVLKLEKEKWKLIEDNSVPDQEDSSDGESPDETIETPKAKKAKTSPVLATKQGKAETSTKKAAASTSKSKATSKSRSKQKDDNKLDSKAKDETLKSIGKSEENKGGKIKDSKSGNKASDSTPKSIGKSKDNDAETSKGGNKAKQETPKSASKSKGKSPKSGGKSNGSKAKVASPAEEDTEDVESSPEPVKVPENSKAKSASKSQKNSKKRKRSTKG